MDQISIQGDVIVCVSASITSDIKSVIITI